MILVVWYIWDGGLARYKRHAIIHASICPVISSHSVVMVSHLVCSIQDDQITETHKCMNIKMAGC